MIPLPNYKNASDSSGPICYAYNLYTGSSGSAPGNVVGNGTWMNTELFLAPNCNIDVDAGGSSLTSTVALYGSNEEVPAVNGGTQIGNNINLTGNQMIQLTGGPYRWIRMAIVSVTTGAIKATMACVSP